MLILHCEPEVYDEADLARLQAVGRLDTRAVPDQEELRAVLASEPVEILFTRIGLEVGEAELSVCPTLRWVITPTTGLDHLDLDRLAAKSVTVISLKGRVHLLDTVHATAEHTWGLLLALVRSTVAAREDVLAGQWQRAPFCGTELHGRTLGVVGCGRLGRMVARYGLAFGMRVLAHDTDPAALEQAPVGTEFVDDTVLLREADVVSLHLPLSEETAGWL